MPFELQVALRYLLAKRRQVFISVISLVSTLGVTIGVMALVIALALMTGLQGELQSRILGSSAHVFIYKPAGITDYHAEVQRLSTVPGVIGAAPAVTGKALISALDNGFLLVKGIDARLESGVTDIGHAVTDGSLDGLTPATEDELAGSCSARISRRGCASFGRSGRRYGSGRARRGIPRMRSFIVTGTFESGIYEYDSALALASIDASRDALDLGSRVTGILVRVHKMEEARAIGKKIMTGIQEPALWANDWIGRTASCSVDEDREDRGLPPVRDHPRRRGVPDLVHAHHDRAREDAQRSASCFPSVRDARGCGRSSCSKGWRSAVSGRCSGVSGLGTLRRSGPLPAAVARRRVLHRHAPREALVGRRCHGRRARPAHLPGFGAVPVVARVAAGPARGDSV